MRSRYGEWVSGGLAIVGAINWGLVGLFNFNLVHTLFGWSRPIERVVYGAVGLSAVYYSYLLTQPTNVIDQAKEKIEERRPIGVA